MHAHSSLVRLETQTLIGALICIGRQVTSLLCLSDIIVLCHIPTYSGTSGRLFEYENVVINSEQEKKSIICVRMG